ncbi:unnamed protein product [Darwinula stevensoni]|uniref:E3 ubiquitin protein ligase n=1 Tax=Darwinula stevensoni TaxID=69355 RepID=A0A7R8WXM9_9CRUS|nr:unnamed protein product [Darwinula stevensoni]CAG0878622.1 unnamed protein product [Darwinula stevensoni]
MSHLNGEGREDGGNCKTTAVMDTKVKQEFPSPPKQESHRERELVKKELHPHPHAHHGHSPHGNRGTSSAGMGKDRKPHGLGPISSASFPSSSSSSSVVDSDLVRDLKAQLKKSQSEQKEMKLLLDMYKGVAKDQRDKLAAMAPIERATLCPIVYYEFFQGHSARAAADNICAAFEGNVVHYSTTVNDKALRNALNTKPNATTRESPTTLGVTHMAIGNHPNDLGYRKVYLTWVPHRLGDSDKASCVQLMAAERKARMEVDELKLQLKKFQDARREERRKLADEDAMRKIRQLEEQVHHLQKMVASHKQEEAALLNEMEVTGQAFEDMQEQNARLIKQLKEKDDANMKLMGERIKSNQINKLGREEKDMLVEQVKTLTTQLEAQRQVVVKLEEKEGLLQASLISVEKEVQLRTQAAETHKRKALEAAQSAYDLNLHLSKSHPGLLMSLAYVGFYDILPQWKALALQGFSYPFCISCLNSPQCGKVQ